MSTRPEFVQYLLDQLEGLGELRAQKMFGDHLIYLNDRPALLVCDGTPFAKPLPCVAELLKDRPKPLALYLFSRNKGHIRAVTERCSFGGGCVNDVVIHLATSAMGFGGVGESGMGAYHGRVGFETFSHRKSIVDKKTWMDLPMRYQPYLPLHEKLIRRFLR